ncbi:MAG: PfkB family carbohydrate kinase [Caldilineaceae bacterium]
MDAGRTGVKLACAARLGLNVASFSQVGGDENGRAIVADFARHGVDTSLIETVAGGQSPFTVILIDPSGEKVILVAPGFAATTPSRKAAAKLPNVRYLYIRCPAARRPL